MRLHVTDPVLALELSEFLRSRADVVADRVGEDEIEVSLLGSYGREGQQVALSLLVRAWWGARAAGPVPVELID